MSGHGRPPTARLPILQALDRCEDLLGASFEWLAEQTGVEHKTLRQVLCKMTKQQELFSIPRYRDSRYFLTEERRALALPHVERHFAELDRLAAERKLESSRRAVIAYTKRKSERLREQREEAKRAKAAARAAERERKAAEQARAREEAKAAAAAARAAAKAPKPKPAPKPKHSQPALTVKPALNAPVSIPSKKPKIDPNAPVIIPPHVKVQQLPGYTPRTFEPPPFFRGEFTNEWREKRGQA